MTTKKTKAPETDPAQAPTPKGRPVIVTTAHRGVFFGFAEDTDGETIKLTQAQLCVYWSADVRGFMGLAADGPTRSCKIGPPADGDVTITAGGESVTVGAEDAPAASPEALKAPVRPVVVEVPEALWNDLPDAVRVQLRLPALTQVWWFVGTEVVTSSSLAAADAVAVGAILEGNGLRCEKREQTMRHGTDVDLWTAERAAEVN